MRGAVEDDVALVETPAEPLGELTGKRRHVWVRHATHGGIADEGRERDGSGPGRGEPSVPGVVDDRMLDAVTSADYEYEVVGDKGRARRCARKRRADLEHVAEMGGLIARCKD